MQEVKLFYDILNQNTSVTSGKTKWSELLDIHTKELGDNPQSTFQSDKGQ